MCYWGYRFEQLSTSGQSQAWPGGGGRGSAAAASGHCSMVRRVGLAAEELAAEELAAPRLEAALPLTRQPSGLRSRTAAAWAALGPTVPPWIIVAAPPEAPAPLPCVRCRCAQGCSLGACGCTWLQPGCVRLQVPRPLAE